jgi:hypothetical protein
LIITEEDEVVVTFEFTFTVETTLTKYVELGCSEYGQSLNLSALDDTEEKDDEESSDHPPLIDTLTLHTYEVSARTTVDPWQSTRAV